MSEPSEPESSNKTSDIRTSLHGVDLPLNSRLNKDTALTEHECDVFGLHGLLPSHIGSLEDQRLRRKCILDSRNLAFGKYSNMRNLQDNDQTLFYSIIEQYREELLPVVYTSAVGEGCQRFSEIWRRPRGLLSAIQTGTGSISIRISRPTAFVHACGALFTCPTSASGAEAIGNSASSEEKHARLWSLLIVWGAVKINVLPTRKL